MLLKVFLEILTWTKVIQETSCKVNKKTPCRSCITAQKIGANEQRHSMKETVLRNGVMLKQERRGWCGIGHGCN